ncbi:hypothetical protein [Streptomyces sp. HUAS ZL42]|uniref:hypothetical protein n=1 Tax=Streptomyces sp. HUAS ZL42 TaxID=3231715 RepID=UPI00345E9EBB
MMFTGRHARPRPAARRDPRDRLIGVGAGVVALGPPPAAGTFAITTTPPRPPAGRLHACTPARLHAGQTALFAEMFRAEAVRRTGEARELRDMVADRLSARSSVASGRSAAGVAERPSRRGAR